MARYLKNSRLANIVEIRNADVSLENLKATQREAMRIAEATGMRGGIEHHGFKRTE